ncbi:MAG: glycosyltransferase family 4 protein [Anaerolineae bacterium]
MRVLMDAHMLGAHETGNETYVRNLLQALGKRDDVEVFAAVLPDQVGLARSLGVTPAPLADTSDIRRLVSGLNGLAREHRVDLMHVTYVGPLVPACPVVVTVHDVSFRRFPRFFSPRERLLFATLLPWTLRRAAAVITVSQHARSEILHFYPHLEGCIHVTLEAADPAFRPLPALEVEKALHRLGIRQSYVLAVGNLQPRKNLVRLVKAFAQADVASRVQLVIVGQAQWQASTVVETVRDLGLESAVCFTGYVGLEDLVALYSGAALFCYPSLYEGFGLPILEAMACGAPVMASKITSLPEVAGDAAILVDPLNVSAMADAMRTVLGDAAKAQALRERGLARAAELGWDRTADGTVGCYRRVLDLVQE